MLHGGAASLFCMKMKPFACLHVHICIASLKEKYLVETLNENFSIRDVYVRDW